MNVVNLADYKKTPKVEKAPDDPRYFCTHCNWDAFKILANRAVHCAGCGLRMKNLEVK